MELFLIKLLDGILNTLKSVYLYKQKNFLSAVLNALAQIAYLTMMVQLVKGRNSLEGIVLISLATFIGSYFPALLIDKLEKEKVFIYDIIPSSNESGKQFADTIRESNMPIQTYKGFNNKLEQVLCSKVYSRTREHSRMLEDLIPEGFKVSISEVRNFIG